MGVGGWGGTSPVFFPSSAATMAAGLADRFLLLLPASLAMKSDMCLAMAVNSVVTAGDAPDMAENLSTIASIPSKRILMREPTQWNGRCRGNVEGWRCEQSDLNNFSVHTNMKKEREKKSDKRRGGM